MTLARRIALGIFVAISLGVSGLAVAQDALRVATDSTFPPFEYSEDGKRIGFDVDLIEAIAAEDRADQTGLDDRAVLHRDAAEPGRRRFRREDLERRRQS